MRTKSTPPKNSTPAITCNAPWRLTKVKPLANYQLEIEFVDGTHGFVDMKPLITSKKAGVFIKLKQIKLFKQVYLEHGVATWPGEIDLAPDAMYDEIQHNGIWVVKDSA